MVYLVSNCTHLTQCPKLLVRIILGHADISMTMRYAHFAPDHLSEAIIHNPLSNL
ncbi:integrase [Vibrio cyclitrophicus]|nr:integrase [Vibrio cyclitrophicus]